MILDILDKHRDGFRIKEILLEEYIKNWRRTSFTWTEQPNSVCLAMNKKYFGQALTNKNIVGIIASPAAVENLQPCGKTVVVSEKAGELFYFLHNLEIHGEYDSRPFRDKAVIQEGTHIADSAIIGRNVTIGRGVVIHERCIIHDNTVIGDDCVLHDNVTIGTQGFFSKWILGRKTHVKHFGGVKMGRNCIVHAGSNISRSANVNEYTLLGDDVHIGIHSNIAHDCRIDDNTDISAKVVLAGRVRIGKNCWIGAAAVISNAVRIGDNAGVKIGSVVIEDIADNATVSGNFALSHVKTMRNYAQAKR